MMMDTYYWTCRDSFADYPIVKPNLITGEGRMKYRPWSAYKQSDLKKKSRRKMAKKSKRANRRQAVELREALFNLKPGDKFIYAGKSYVLLSVTPMDLGAPFDTTDFLCAVELESYKVMCFYKSWEVTKV